MRHETEGTNEYEVTKVEICIGSLISRSLSVYGNLSLPSNRITIAICLFVHERESPVQLVVFRSGKESTAARMSGLICSACRSALNRPSRLGSHLTDLADAGVFEMTKSLRWPVSRQNYSSRAFRGLPNLRVLCEGPNREFRTTATHQRTFASTAGGDGSSRRSLSNLPDKVEVLTGPLGRLSKVLQPRRSDSITTRVGSSYGGNHSLEWVQPPNNVLIVKKQNDVRALEAMKELIR